MEPNFVLNIIFDGDPLHGLDEDPPGLLLDKTFNTGVANVADPIQNICERAQFETLEKRESVTDDAGWDEPLETLALSPAFLERSAARLKNTYAIIDRIFAGHENECAEAKAIVCQTLINTRNDVAKIMTA